MKVGDKVILIDTSDYYNYNDDYNYPYNKIKINNTYEISLILEYLRIGGIRHLTDTDFCYEDTEYLEFRFVESETRGYSYNTKRFISLKKERKLKLQNISDKYER